MRLCMLHSPPLPDACIDCLPGVPGGGWSYFAQCSLRCIFGLQMEGVEQLVSGEGPSGFGLPAMLQQYVEHGGCLFKVRPAAPPMHVCYVQHAAAQRLSRCRVVFRSTLGPDSPYF